MMEATGVAAHETPEGASGGRGDGGGPPAKPPAASPAPLPSACAAAPTPQRRRSNAATGDGGERRAACAPSGPDPEVRRAAADAQEGRHDSSVPEEARGLSWPAAFCKAKGERLELSDERSLARRTSGVGRGVAFVGPLSLEHGLAYFEVEVAEMEPNRTQTLAIGVCSSLPEARALRAERARDLGRGSYIMGYDLPKVFVHGAEAARINTKHWRPLKELAVGDRVGLLVDRPSMELTVFVNGAKRASASCLGAGGGASPEERWQNEVWGVVDVHGTVRAARLQGPAAPRGAPLQRSLTVAQDAGGEGGARGGAEPAAQQSQVVAAGLRRCASGIDVAPGVKKRMRMSCHPCGCMVHLIRHTNDVVHVPRKGDFVIGRNPRSCNLTLDSSDVPNMVSRRHAVIVSADDAVILQDCESLNGTFVNGRRIGRETLRQSDTVVVGNPAQSPIHFQFSVSMPPSA